MCVLDYSLMVEDSVVETCVTEYRLKPNENGEAPLMAVSLSDRLSDGISMVYSFYDPDAPARSLGTYMILEQVEYARKHGIPSSISAIGSRARARCATRTASSRKSTSPRRAGCGRRRLTSEQTAEQVEL